MWTHLSRIRGGIGLRGPGETQLETDRRMIRQKIQWLKGKLRDVERHRETIRAGPGADAEREPGGLHQRRQVERAARPLGPARDRGRGPALRHARHADPRGGPRRGLPGPGDRHGRVHPQAAPPPGGQLPRHARGGARRPTCCCTWWTRVIPGWEEQMAGGRGGAGGARPAGPAGAAGVQQDGPRGRRRSSSGAGCTAHVPRRGAHLDDADRRAQQPPRGAPGARAAGAARRCGSTCRSPPAPRWRRSTGWAR